jgi:hypothetical protein
MIANKMNLLVLKLLGFTEKPWKEYPNAWWFDDRVVLSDLNDVKNFPELIRICMVQYTEVSEMKTEDRIAIVHDLLKKIGPQ